MIAPIVRAGSLVILSGLAACSALAQSSVDPTADRPGVPPPPGVNDRGGSPASTPPAREQPPRLVGGDPSLRPSDRAGPDGPWNHRVLFATSPDGRGIGESGEVLRSVTDPDILQLERALPRADAALAGDKTILVYASDARGRTAQSTTPIPLVVIASRDAGRTWGAPKPVSITGLPSSVTPAEPSVVQLPDGRLRLFFRVDEPAPAAGSTPAPAPTTDPTRKPEARIAAAVSDDGITFSLEEGACDRGENIASPEVLRVGDAWLMFLAQGNRVVVSTSTDGLRFTRRDGVAIQGGQAPGAIALGPDSVRVFLSTMGGISSALYTPSSGAVAREPGIVLAGRAAAVSLAPRTDGSAGSLAVLRRPLRESGQPVMTPPGARQPAKSPPKPVPKTPSGTPPL